MTRIAILRLVPWLLLAGWLAYAPSCLATAAKEGLGKPDLRLKVTELARTVDLNRGNEEFLTVTVEVSGADPNRLRRVQPTRANFTLGAGKSRLPCRWLRGGSIPEDPARLRFTLGFSLPLASVKRVELLAKLPQLEEGKTLELRLTGLQPGQEAVERSGPGWSVQLQRLAEERYVPPALPTPGRFISKLGPVDERVFRKSTSGTPEPVQAMVLAFQSPSTALYDPTLDVAGELTLEGGGTLPLLAAFLHRQPSATVTKPRFPPIVRAEFYFPAPGKSRVNGATLRFFQRPQNTATQSLRISGLPVPGR